MHPRTDQYNNAHSFERETFFDKFGQEEPRKNMPGLLHNDKARKLREELEQQIKEKKARQEEEKMERDRWE